MNTPHELSEQDLERVASGKDVPYVPPMPWMGAGMRPLGGPTLGTAPFRFQ
jgi:hypothetical protein